MRFVSNADIHWRAIHLSDSRDDLALCYYRSERRGAFSPGGERENLECRRPTNANLHKACPNRARIEYAEGGYEGIVVKGDRKGDCCE